MTVSFGIMEASPVQNPAIRPGSFLVFLYALAWPGGLSPLLAVLPRKRSARSLMLSGYASSGTCHQTIQLSGQKDVKATHQNGFITPNSSKICIDEWFSLRPFILQIARSFVYVCASGI